MFEWDLAIAIVDDEESVRKALGRLLRSAGYKVNAFGRGGDFLDSLKLHRPACTVMDVHLPGLSGLHVQRYLRHQHLEIPCIIITGEDESEVREQALNCGAVAYLRKPLDADFLLSTISSALSEYRAHKRKTLRLTQQYIGRTVKPGFGQFACNPTRGL